MMNATAQQMKLTIICLPDLGGYTIRLETTNTLGDWNTVSEGFIARATFPMHVVTNRPNAKVYIRANR